MDYEDIIKVSDKGLILPYKESIHSNIEERIGKILIPEECIQKRVDNLAKQICKDYKRGKKLDLVGILDGAFIFVSDLGRKIYNHNGPEIRLHFIDVETYGKGIKKTKEKQRKVKIKSGLGNMKGKDVLLVEDLVDQGFTLSGIKQYLIEKQVNSVKICVLVNKILEEASQEIKELRNKLVFDYIGFEIPDKWIAGYGLDAGGKDFRLLPFIVTVNEDYYK